MPVAVISDVHGNLPALRAVLSEIEELRPEAVLCCGDVASGPLPTATVDRLMALEVPLIAVRGNADRGAVEAFDGTADEATTHEDDLWTGRQLTREHRDYLQALPTTLTLPVAGIGDVLLCHGSPRRDDEVLLETMPDDQLASALDAVEADLVLCGNTHMQFDQRVGATRLVNVGSVGWPYGETGAHWAVVGPDVELRRTPYDLRAAEAELRRRSTWPRLDDFIERVLLRPLTREEATAFFSGMGP